MILRNDEHMFFCGVTQSGKTTLVSKFSRLIKLGHLVIIDPKHEVEFKNAVVVHHVRDVLHILNSGKNVIVRCAPTQENYDAVARLVYLRGNTVLVLDEAAGMLPEHLTQAFNQLFTAGCKRRAVCWFLTQRSALVSKTAISQAKHCFIFSLILINDKKAICANIPMQVDDFDRIGPYQFFYWHQGDKTARLMSS